MIKQFTIIYRLFQFVNRFRTIGIIFLHFLEFSHKYNAFSRFLPQKQEKAAACFRK